MPYLKFEKLYKIKDKKRKKKQYHNMLFYYNSNEI